MFKKVSILIVFILAVNVCSSQNSINDYKYVIVPNSYEFTKEPDQFKLNSLSKFLFNKYGFVALMNDEPLPQELINNGCLTLHADVIKDPSIFKTKLQIELKNCRKEVVFLSRVGESREKNYQVAYNLALREAFDSFETLNYQYKPSKNSDIIEDTTENASAQKEIKRLQEEVKILKQEKQVDVVQNTPKETIPEPKTIAKPNLNVSQVFTAKLKYEGVFAYDLIDGSGLIAYTIIFSGKEDVYIVKDSNAIIYKMNGNWVFAKSKPDNSLEVKAIKITF